MATTSTFPEEKHQTLSPLFTLFPPEVRENIYRFALSVQSIPWDGRAKHRPERLFFDGQYDFTWQEANPNCMGALLACKSMHNEIAPLLYRHVEICLCFDSRAEIQFLRVDPRYRQHTKTITIDIDSGRPDWYPNVLRRAPPSQEHRARWASLCVQRAVDFLRIWESGGTNIHTVTFKASWHSANCSESECTDPNQFHGCLGLGPLLRNTTVLSKIPNVTFVNFPSLHGSRLQGRCARSRPLKEDQESSIVIKLGLNVVSNPPIGLFTLTNPTARARRPVRVSSAIWEAKLHQQNQMLLENGIVSRRNIWNDVSAVLNRDNDVLNGVDSCGNNWAMRDLVRKKQALLLEWDETLANTDDQALYLQWRDMNQRRMTLKVKKRRFVRGYRAVRASEMAPKMDQAGEALERKEEAVINNLYKRMRTM